MNAYHHNLGTGGGCSCRDTVQVDMYAVRSFFVVALIVAVAFS
jgi:hypothetical protein